MDDNAVNEIIKANVARTRMRETIITISKRLCSKYRHKRIKMEELSSVFREYGSYINTADSYGETCMHVACRLEACDRDVLRELLIHGGQVDILNGSGDSSLHLVARNPQRLDLMQELLKYCRNSNVTNIRGETPLYVAVTKSKDDLAMVYELLEHGADFRIADNKGRNSLHAAVKNPSCSIDLIKKFLLEAPTFVDCKDNTDSTPLHGAVRCNNLEIVKELLDRGANPNAQNKRGKSPLHIAVSKPYANNVEILLKYGAEVNAVDSSHQTPLHHSLSVEIPDITVVETLLRYGANVNAVDQYGMNVLYVAVCNPTTPYEIVKLFLENGAKPNFDNQCNILVNIDHPDRYHIAELLIPYIILRNINANSTGAPLNLNHNEFANLYIDQFRAVLLGSINESSDNYKHFLREGTACVLEFLNMTHDFICNDITLFQFVSENCTRTTPHEQNVLLSAIDNVLLRLTEQSYQSCKDLIYTSIKHSVLLNRLCELEVAYNIPDGETVILNSLCIHNVAKYLSKDDMIHMIMAFCDKFNDVESPKIVSKRSSEEHPEIGCKKRRE